MDYLILLSSIALGAITVFGFRLADVSHIKLLNAFTGAYLLTLTMLHLLPDLYVVEAGAAINPLAIGGFILFGFFLQIALDAISQGIEHGHAHHVRGKLPIGIIIGLCLHAFVEAMALGQPCGNHSHHEHSSRQFLLISVVVHNYPVTIALLAMLLHSGMKRSSALGILALFAVAAPLGMFISTHTGLAVYSRELMAIVIGIFMHISTTILFESSDHHRFPVKKVAVILLGLLLGIASVVI